jgi:hypothetical protein
MKADTKEFPTRLLLLSIHNPGAFVPIGIGELLAWMTGESWKATDYSEGIDICAPWLKVWFPELTKLDSSELPETYHVPQINR